MVIEYFKSKNLWLPSFLSPSITSAVDSVETKIRFYPISEELSLSNSNFLDQVQPKDVFLFIDYFGFPFDLKIIPKLKERGAYLIHDCSQALFFDWRKSQVDFILYSPRKFLGIPDGGILVNKPDLDFKPPIPSTPPQNVFLNLLLAVIERREFDIFGGTREWFACFRKAETMFTSVPYAMSELSTILLKNAFDYEQIKIQRRKNYKLLANQLQQHALLPDLPDNVIPLGFPIVSTKRDQIQVKLFKRNIFPPIHWQLNDIVPTHFIQSHNLSKIILTLPCDQRYNETDMTFLAESVLEMIA